jgi:hypothetical protein
MHEFMPEVAVPEQRRPWFRVDGAAIPHLEPDGVVHPAVDGDHEQ